MEIFTYQDYKKYKIIFEEKLGYEEARKIINKINEGYENMLSMVDTIRK